MILFCEFLFFFFFCLACPVHSHLMRYVDEADNSSDHDIYEFKAKTEAKTESSGSVTSSSVSSSGWNTPLER